MAPQAAETPGNGCEGPNQQGEFLGNISAEGNCGKSVCVCVLGVGGEEGGVDLGWRSVRGVGEFVQHDALLSGTIRAESQKLSIRGR